MNKIYSNFIRLIIVTAVAIWGSAIFSYAAEITPSPEGDFTFTSYSATYGVITGYSGPGGDVVIPDTINNIPVMSINPGAFKGNDKITSVTILGTTSIGDSAFRDCTSLTSVTIKGDIPDILNSAFNNCTSLESITISENNTLKTIGISAFENCQKLKGITIPNNVKTISKSAFKDCISLGSNSQGSITIPASVTSLDNTAFLGCTSLTKIDVIKDNTKYSSTDGVVFTKDGKTLLIYPTGKAGAYAIPDGVGIIKNYAFQDCTKLTGVTIPNGVTSIEEKAFQSCTGLKSVTINGAPNMGIGVFSDCTSLTSVDMKGSITSIPSYAFQACSSLTSIEIPSSVATIEQNAFQGCDSLTSINVDESNNTYKSTDGVVFTKNGETLFLYPAGKAANYVVPTSVKTIGQNAFANCNAITNVSIEDGVTTIDRYAFYNCQNLKSITIPASVVNPIYKSAFEYCTSLDSVYCTPGSKADDSSLYPNKNIIKYFTTNDVFEYVTTSNTIKITGYKGSDTDVVIPSTIDGKAVTSIGDEAFSFEKCNTDITSVAIPASVTSIGEKAFYGCSVLTRADIPANVTYIGASAFSGCNRLESLIIPDKLTSISNSAFAICGGLKSVTIPANVTSIGNNAFDNCRAITKIEIKDGSQLKSIGNGAFTYCTNLTSITIPENVETIGNDAFSNCNALTSVEIPSSVKSIGYNAFLACTKAQITVLCGNANIFANAFAGVPVIKCFQGSSASQYPVQNYIPHKIYIQEQGSLSVSVPKPTDGKWIQKLEINIYKDGEGSTPVTRELIHYNESDTAYTFPVSVTANYYLGKKVSLPYEVYCYYNYNEEQVADSDFKNYVNAESDNGNPTDKTQLYRQNIANSNVDITLVELPEGVASQ